MPLVAGVDSSTQSTKVILCDLEDGSVVGSASAPHPAVSPPASEQDPRAWWEALGAAFGELGPVTSDVAAVSVSGQQHGLVMLDADGAVVRPAKLWNDTTSAPEADRLVDELGAEVWAQACGSVPVAAFTITKLAWMAAHEPESLDRAAMVMLPHDYLTWRLTGRHVTDRGDASGTGWFDPSADEYRADLLETALDDGAAFLDHLPRVLGPGETAGELSSSAATELGLTPSIPVGPGTGDNMGAALGLGLEPGDVALSLGTSGTVYAVSPTGTADPSGLVAGFADAAGGFLPLVCTLNATKVTDTMAAWLGTDAAGLADLAGTVAAGAETPVLVPYFDGERTPNLPDSSGLMGGLRTGTTREELARAAHDGVLCGLMAGLDALRAAGVPADGRLNLIGGGARSAAYRQRCADLHGETITVPDADEAVALGAAVQAAAVATGSSVRDIAASWRLGAGTEVDPDPDADGAAVRARYHALAAQPWLTGP